MSETPTVVAGATGDLGGRIVAELRSRGARVRALVRSATAPEAERLRGAEAEVLEVDYDHGPALERACEGAGCVVSALSGLRDGIVEAQTRLLDAAVSAGVPRFIPSDFAIDFTEVPPEENRNFALRQEFRRRLEERPIRATSILNGMFAELLNGAAPVVVRPIRRVVYWEDADQPLNFTTIPDVAAFTAEAALDPDTPRWLRISGDTLTARQLAEVASEVTGHRFRLLRAGPASRLAKLIALTRRLAPAEDDVFPAWQGMQYLHNMFSGKGTLLPPLDNDRYPELRWTPVAEVLKGG